MMDRDKVSSLGLDMNEKSARGPQCAGRRGNFVTTVFNLADGVNRSYPRLLFFFPAGSSGLKAPAKPREATYVRGPR